MKHYINIKVLPDPEFTETILMNALYAKCHRILGEVGEGDVGVSFPNHKKTLGAVLRLHGTEAKLNKIMAENWLKGLGDYTQVSTVLTAPDSGQHRTVAHVRKKSPHNKRQRVIKKGWLTEQEAYEKFKDSDQVLLKWPYAQIKSLSTQSNMRVFIKHGDIVDVSVTGQFSTYGLSKTATIPWF